MSWKVAGVRRLFPALWVRAGFQGPINEPDVIGAFRGLEVSAGAGHYWRGGRQSASVHSFFVRSRDNTTTPMGESRQRGELQRMDLDAIQRLTGARVPDSVPENIEQSSTLVFWIGYILRGETRTVGWVIVDRTNRIVRLLQSGRSTTARSRATVQAVARRVGWSPVPGWLLELDQPE